MKRAGIFLLTWVATSLLLGRYVLENGKSEKEKENRSLSIAFFATLTALGAALYYG